MDVSQDRGHTPWFEVSGWDTEASRGQAAAAAVWMERAGLPSSAGRSQACGDLAHSMILNHGTEALWSVRDFNESSNGNGLILQIRKLKKVTVYFLIFQQLFFFSYIQRSLSYLEISYRLPSGRAYFPIFQTQLNITVAVSIPCAQKTSFLSVPTFSNGDVGNGILWFMRIGIFHL